MIAEKLLLRLEGVIRRGDGKWYARCPAHPDKSPSLSIEDAGDKVLVCCHAGCPTEDVLAAVGLTFRDLYPDESRVSYKLATSSKTLKLKFDPLEVERWALKIADGRIRRGEELSVEDRARVEVARLRLEAAEGDSR